MKVEYPYILDQIILSIHLYLSIWYVFIVIDEV